MNEFSRRALLLIPLLLAAGSAQDEYVTLDESRRLFERARQPKRWVVINGRNHRYEGKEDELFSQLEETLKWETWPRP